VKLTIRHYVAIAAIAAIMILIWVPKIEVIPLWNEDVDVRDVFKAENDARATLAQILGGAALLAGLYFAWQTIDATNKNLELTKEGQITERFTKAIEQLGSSKLEIRLGGIYALERIARDSKKDHWPIMEVLTAHVRENAQKPELEHKLKYEDLFSEDLPLVPLATNIQAILTVIGRRTLDHENGQNLDLHETDLHGANLHNTHLKGANLNETNLIYADLEGAHLEGAHLSGAHLSGAHLEDTDLTKVHGLTQQQINPAIGNKITKLPPGLVMPESWKE
jgi:Pentapeptide repeats (8 copies)